MNGTVHSIAALKFEDRVHWLLHPLLVGTRILGAYRARDAHSPHLHLRHTARSCAPARPARLLTNLPEIRLTPPPPPLQLVIGTLLQTQGEYLKGCEEEDKSLCSQSQIHYAATSGSVNVFGAAVCNAVCLVAAVTTAIAAHCSLSKATRYGVVGGDLDGLGAGLLQGDFAGGSGALERRDSYTDKEEKNRNVYGSFQEDRL